MLGLVTIIRYWVSTSFYIVAELWSNIILSVLFWGFANEITKISEAKRFYGLIGFMGNLSGVIAGSLAWYCNKLDYMVMLPFGCDSWEQTLYLLLSIVILSGLFIIMCHRWMYLKVFSGSASEANKIKKKTKYTMSLSQTIMHLVKSPCFKFIFNCCFL